MMRINVVGTSGAGKSTFAKKLAEKLGHPSFLGNGGLLKIKKPSAGKLTARIKVFLAHSL
jgi:adenylate kinase family enzyme